jgi:hypothetical protein
MLGLDAGGDCTGVAFRIAEEVLEAELALLWRREMVAGSYVPRWVDALDADGRRFGSAIAFTIDAAGEQYAGRLAREIVVERLATASGALGSAAEYLFQTRDGLRPRHPRPQAGTLAPVRRGRVGGRLTEVPHAPRKHSRKQHQIGVHVVLLRPPRFARCSPVRRGTAAVCRDTSSSLTTYSIRV